MLLLWPICHVVIVIVIVISVEITVRGQVTSANKNRLKAFIYRVCSEPKHVFKEIVPICSKISLLSSFSIFTARNEPSWINPLFMIH